MHVYTCTNFEGCWPVGTAAVIVAPDEKQALHLLRAELAKQGLEVSWSETVELVNAQSEQVIILLDGNY